MRTFLPPTKQIDKFLGWFNFVGIDSFDIHIRKPLSKNADYKHGDWIWLTNNEDIPAKDILYKYLSWLKYLNTYGSDIYFRPHREKKHPVIFLDDVSIEKATMVADKYTSCVVETSKNNTQIWIATDRELGKSSRKKAQKFLKDLKFTDPGSISGDHLGRLCGMHSKKHNDWVNLFKCSGKNRYTPKFNNDEIYSLPKGKCASKTSKNGKDNSISAKEFGWVLGMLRHGIEKNIVFNKLFETAKRRGKENVKKYTVRTIRNALRIL